MPNQKKIITEKQAASQGFSYAQHVRLAIELIVVREKLSCVYSAVYACYPKKMCRKLPYPSERIPGLKNLLDSELFFEQRESSLPVNAKTIYYSAFGENIFEHQGIGFSIVESEAWPWQGQKEKFTTEQYLAVKDLLCEVSDMLCFWGMVATASYSHQSKIKTQFSLLREEVGLYQVKLIELLKKKHGTSHEMFLVQSERPFLDGSFTNLAPSKQFYSKYIKALMSGDTSGVLACQGSIRGAQIASNPEGTKQAVGATRPEAPTT